MLSQFASYHNILIDLVWLKAVDGVSLHGKTTAILVYQTFCCGKKTIISETTLLFPQLSFAFCPAN